MEILYTGAVWEGYFPDVVFHHTKIILKKDSEFYYASLNERIKEEDIDVCQLKCKRIPDHHIYADAPDNFLRAPNPLPSDVYVKTPMLIGYNDTFTASDIPSLTLSEIRILEVLKQYPHPNIVQYFGCLETDNTIRGICYAKHGITLGDHLERGYPLDVDKCLSGIEKAVSHLHSLRLVHNDLTPYNIMLNDRNEPILIDFDSCLYEGEKIRKGGTPEWSDCGAKIASFSNDEFALERIREYLAAYKSDSV
ncbi:hypothetical protein NPX13_g1742 [Xylaria arbuscula]|uniref:EKC/KEOPS complex subunit BUD32 n=1 Tax=Xylaria arbuscula TaxID=114810 RepID=A0A9W8NL25_9PEZI|nr:hypothetical protein NPX13_g1742 [Xylaria arbuscula]